MFLYEFIGGPKDGERIGYEGPLFMYVVERYDDDRRAFLEPPGEPPSTRPVPLVGKYVQVCDCPRHFGLLYWQGWR